MATLFFELSKILLAYGQIKWAFVSNRSILIWENEVLADESLNFIIWKCIRSNSVIHSIIKRLYFIVLTWEVVSSLKFPTINTAIFLGVSPDALMARVYQRICQRNCWADCIIKYFHCSDFGKILWNDDNLWRVFWSFKSIYLINELLMVS